MHVCEYCGSESEFPSVIIDCEARCEADDRNTRSWFAKYNDGRGRE